jgi:glycosyltransferase involved in cell wall biosynthesis
MTTSHDQVQKSFSGRFSVVVPTFRRTELLSKVIQAIELDECSPICVLVIYRPEEDPETALWLQDYAKSHRIIQPLAVYEGGKVAALNLALEHAPGEFIVMLDDDIVVRSGWFLRTLSHFDNPLVAAVGGHDIVHDPAIGLNRAPVARAGYRAWSGRMIGGHDLVVGEAREVEVLKGCNWAVRRSALGTLRFDERLLGIGAQAGDDYWFCLNLRHAHWKIILDPSAVVDHYPAFKPDYAQGTWGKRKCFEWTANQTAHNLAFLPPLKKMKYLGHSLLVGVRHCPGIYFIAHSLVKRPKSLKGQLIGGWAGFRRGWRMAKTFTAQPPGRPNSPPAVH